MTFKELQDIALGDDFDETRRTVTKAFINQALGRLHRALKLPSLDARATVATVASTASYALPADFVTLHDDEAILNGTDVLEPVDISEFDQVTSPNGQPRYFALSENLIRLYPTPDKVYTLTMRYRSVQTLSADADVPTLAADQHVQLAWFARAKLYLMTDDPQMHDSILVTLPRELQAENLASGQQRVPRRTQVPGTWSRQPIGPRFHHPSGIW